MQVSTRRMTMKRPKKKHEQTALHEQGLVGCYVDMFACAQYIILSTIQSWIILNQIGKVG